MSKFLIRLESSPFISHIQFPTQCPVLYLIVYLSKIYILQLRFNHLATYFLLLISIPFLSLWDKLDQIEERLTEEVHKYVHSYDTTVQHYEDCQMAHSWTEIQT